METEKQVETHLKKKVEELKGICYKFVSPGRDSVPDRICVLPNLLAFVECKGTHGKVSPKQDRELQRLADLKMNVFVVSSRKEVDALIERLKGYADI